MRLAYPNTARSRLKSKKMWLWTLIKTLTPKFWCWTFLPQWRFWPPCLHHRVTVFLQDWPSAPSMSQLEMGKSEWMERNNDEPVVISYWFLSILKPLYNEHPESINPATIKMSSIGLTKLDTCASARFTWTLSGLHCVAKIWRNQSHQTAHLDHLDPVTDPSVRRDLSGF